MIALQWQNLVSIDILALIFIWIKLNSHFLHNSNNSKSCLQKQFLAVSHKFSTLNFEKVCEMKIKHIWKSKYFNFAGA